MQASRLLFGLGDVFPSDAKIGLTERLARLYPQPGAKVILGLSGADAIDAAMKTAILATKKPGVIAFKGAYHGLATGPLSLLGYHTEFREPFEPHTSTHVRFATFPTNRSELDHALSTVEHVLKEQPIGAVFVEPILGRGGVVVPPDGFLMELRTLTKRTKRSWSARDLDGHGPRGFDAHERECRCRPRRVLPRKRPWRRHANQCVRGQQRGDGRLAMVHRHGR